MHKVSLNTYLCSPFQFDFSLEFDIPPAKNKPKEKLSVWNGSGDCFEAEWFHMATKKWGGTIWYLIILQNFTYVWL